MTDSKPKDYILFENIYGPQLLKILFYVISIFAIIAVIAQIAVARSFWAAVYSLISLAIGILMLRVICELGQILYSMHRELRRINKSINKIEN